jgi:hypothetical protein
VKPANMRSISLLSRCLPSDRINTHGSFTFFTPVLSIHVCPMANDSAAKNMLTHRLSSSFLTGPVRSLFFFPLLNYHSSLSSFFPPPLAFQGNNFYTVLHQICSLVDVLHIHKSPIKKAPNPTSSRIVSKKLAHA